MNVFVDGLFPDRNKTLFAELCRRWRVLAFNDCGFPQGEAYPYESADDHIGELEPVSAEALAWNLGQLLRFGDEQLARLVGPDVNVDCETFQVLTHWAHQALHATRRLEALHAAVPLDLVLTSADFDVHRRSTVLEARRLGIPSVSVEHGFLTTMPTRDVFKPEMRGHFAYAADVVSLDNVIEVEAATQAHDLLHADAMMPEFVANGTPIDNAVAPQYSQAEAKKRLGLDPKRFTVVVIGGWIDASAPALVFKQHVEAVESFEKLFAAWARRADREDFDVVVKLHPAFAEWDLEDESRECLHELADAAGCPRPIVRLDGLDEAVLAADLVLAFAFTSVLWDCFQQRRPAVVWPHPILVERLASPQHLREGNEFLRRGVLRCAFSGDEVWDWVDHYHDPSHRAEFERSAEQIQQEFNLGFIPAQQKAQQLASWIERRFGDPSARAQP